MRDEIASHPWPCSTTKADQESHDQRRSVASMLRPARDVASVLPLLEISWTQDN